MEIIKYPENVVHETFDKNIAEWNEEVRQLLPDVPIDLKVEFNNEWLIPDTGTGGFASSKEKLNYRLMRILKIKKLKSRI